MAGATPLVARRRDERLFTHNTKRFSSTALRGALYIPDCVVVTM